MEDHGLLSSAWNDLEPGAIGLKVMQVIALEAPGSERLRRKAVAIDKEALRDYGRAVEHFLFPPRSSGGHSIGQPERSLSDKEPEKIGPPFHFHAGTGAKAIKDCCVNAPRSGEEVVQAANGLWFSWSDAHWDHLRNAGTDVDETWKAWMNAFNVCVEERHWTGWITVGTQVRVHGQLEPQELIASAYLFGHGQLPSESKQWQIARRVQKLLIQQLVDAHEEQIIRQSRAAAISQVLARTLSHNLGSHSLNAFSSEPAMLGQFEKLEEDIRTNNPLPGRVVQTANENDNEPVDTSKRRREWLATYNNYLRERMDLLADITTAVPAFEMPKQLVADLLEGYSRNKLLATTIAGTGGRFRYCWLPDIQVGDRKDVHVAIPSDILGAHAFYLILENIVRNSAKHGGHSEEVVFTVSITEPTEPEWKKKGLLCVQITESRTDLKKNTSLVRERNASINAPVLDDKTRRVRDNGWGTLEMKAACAYLRRIALEELDEKRYQVPDPEKDKDKPVGDEPPLLRAIGGEGTGFGYEFYLMRPKLVMVCGDEGTDEAVIKTANLNQDGANSLQDHGIGAVTLDELEAITKGERKEVVNHALLVFLAKGEDDLKRFIRAALMDLAALPHEMVVVGCEKCDVGTFKTLLGSAKTELKSDKNSQLSPVAIDHNASILERSMVWMDRPKWVVLSSAPAKLYMEVRHRWLVGWMDCLKTSINKVPRVYSEYLKGRVNGDLPKTAQSSIYVDYQAHADFYVPVTSRLEFKCPEKALPEDLSPFLLRQRSVSPSGELVVVQRYPDALSRIMTLGWKDKSDPSDELTKHEDIQVLAQHHLASWTKGVAVIDERVQGCAENDTYQPEATELNPSPSAIRIKDLLCMGAVFVPPSSIIDLQRSDAFTAALWEALVEQWLSPLQGVLGYVCVHLTLLEKFSKPMEMKVEGLLDVLRSILPGIRIIVVSGRGKPPELPKTELFMSYSALSQYTTQTFQRAPVLLNLLAHNTRRIIL